MPVRVNWRYAGEDHFGEGFLRRGKEHGLTRCRVYLVQSAFQARANESDVREDQQLYFDKHHALICAKCDESSLQSPDTLDGPIIIHM